jgi:hypothetical protein
MIPIVPASRIELALLQGGHLATLAPTLVALRRAAANPRPIQETLLSAHLERTRDTAYGTRHGIDRVTSVSTYQDRVPVADYDALGPWIERVARGEHRVLSSEEVTAFEKSGGSTATNKLVPYSKSLLREFNAAVSPWIASLFLSHPRLLTTRSYWSVSPAGRKRERTAGGFPIGFEDDTEYFGPIVRWGMQRLAAVPSTVTRIADMNAWRETTLRHLLSAGDLGLISVWSPTFITLLMEHLELHLDALVSELSPRRRGAVMRACESGFSPERIWPRLGLLSCWVDAASSQFVPQVRKYFPTLEIQPKGLLATEGVVSFPLSGVGNVGAALSHFLEFIDLEHPDRRPLLLDELRVGGRYSPLLSTGSGFSRYHLKDIVTCTGHYRRLPLLRFDGKLDRVTDLCGEKINEEQVTEALRRAEEELGERLPFALLAPTSAPRPHYRLYVEARSDADARRVGSMVERHLASGHHYRYCRELGQLDALAVVLVRDGFARFESALIAGGARAGDVKPTRLDARPIWAEVFREFSRVS